LRRRKNRNFSRKKKEKWRGRKGRIKEVLPVLSIFQFQIGPGKKICPRNLKGEGRDQLIGFFIPRF
jgi:hypothetical protein